MEKRGPPFFFDAEHVIQCDAKEDKMTSFNSLQDLKSVSAQLKKEAKRIQQEKLAERALAIQRKNNQSEFLKAMGDLGVRPIEAKQRVEHKFEKPFRLQNRIESTPSGEIPLSDEHEGLDFVTNDEHNMFRLPYVSEVQVKQMMRGMRAIEAVIDLHGYVADEARSVFSEFLSEAADRGMRCVKIIHGKGHGSSNQKPVLKVLVRRWLRQTPGVLAFSDAQESYGGSGTTLVMLAASKKQ